MREKKIKMFNALKPIILLLVLLLSCVFTDAFASDTSDDYLSTNGSVIYDDAGNPVRLTGIAWFGFETQNQVYHGLWNTKMEEVLDTVADLGFNVLRIPLCVQLVNQWRSGDGGEPNSVNYSANPALEGMTSLQILDASIAYCKQIGLKVMLDMHRVVNTQMLNTWYTDGYPPSDFEACWQWLAQHYANDDTIIAMDLFNEPHGGPGGDDMAKWDNSTDKNNWKYEAEKVANLILDVNPELLIVVEGIEATPKDGYTYTETDSDKYDLNWWGGNLRRVKDYPIDLGNRQSQLVYSPHDYGPSVYAQPWFYSGFTKATLSADCWEPNWLHIVMQDIDPILVGEWGGKMDGGDNQKWMGALTETIVQYDLNHTFWCINPNSGDTGGILLDDWQSVDNAKYNLIEPTLWQDANGKYIGLDHQVNLGANGTHVGAIDNPDEGGDEVAATGVSVNPTSTSVDVDATITLTATVTPSNATNKNVTWSSSDTNVATVSSAGVVTGVSTGSATITATTDNGGFTAASDVTVSEATENFTLTLVVSGNGTTSPSIGSHTYAPGTSVSITATPAGGGTFTGWSGTATSTTNPITITMDANKTLTANFSEGDSEGGSDLPDECSGQCNAATPVNPTLLSDGGLGNVTMYSTASSNGGACNYGTTDVMNYAAINVNVLPGDAQGQWQGGKICGQCAEVTALTSQGPKTVVVRIMDKCPDGNCGIDLGGDAPAAIMLDGNGRYEGEWRFVSCDGHPEVSDGPPTLDVLQGSNPWWSRVHVRNAPMATDTIEWQDADGTAKGSLPFATNPENAFEVPVDEVLQSGMSSVLMTVHYVDGTTATVTLTPDELATASASYTLDNFAADPDQDLPPTSDPAETEPTPDPETPPAADADTAGLCQVDYSMNQWNNGFAADVAVTNNSDQDIGGWTLTWTFADGQHVTGAWNAEVVQSGADISASNPESHWNGTIPANGGNVRFGFQGSHKGVNAVPVDFKLNGVTCNDGVNPTPEPNPEPTPGPEPTPTAHVDNPFGGADGYINPDYTAKVLAEAQSTGGTLGAAMAKVANYSTAVWMDRIAAIEGRADLMGLRAHLDEALQQQNGETPMTIMVVIYDLPNRDCAAAASNGELLIAEDGLNIYKTKYIDPLAEILSDPKYSSLRIVAIIEPDSLPNLVTNLDIDACAEANNSGAYVDGISYAIDKLHPIENVYLYLDIAHSGWLGWDSNFTPAVELYTRMLQNTAAGVNSIDGFITNTANYTPVEEVYLPDADLNVGGQPLKSADFYEWNPYFDEKDFATDLRKAFINAGMPSTVGMLIDTSRSGWGGSQRPNSVSGSTDLNTYVDQSRVDRRPHRGGWCNQQGAGIGARPEVAPASGIDAYVWVKPPGESDGVSSAGIVDPDDPNKTFDVMCDPNAQSTYNANYPTNAMSDAPHAGRWFGEQFRMLIENADPPLVDE
jgi:cellulose 1,4-beta-cellobiosidase